MQQQWYQRNRQFSVQERAASVVPAKAATVLQARDIMTERARADSSAGNVDNGVTRKGPSSKKSQRDKSRTTKGLNIINRKHCNSGATK